MLPTSPQSDKLCLRCKAELAEPGEIIRPAIARSSWMTDKEFDRAARAWALFIGELPNRFETEHEAELNALHRLFGEEF
jgi:hypothetical protein